MTDTSLSRDDLAPDRRATSTQSTPTSRAATPANPALGSRCTRCTAAPSSSPPTRSPSSASSRGARWTNTRPTHTRSPRRSGCRRRDDAGARLAQSVHERVRDKLQREAVEDFRIDYEDGYGVRPDAEEDGHAASGRERESRRAMRENTLSPFIGIRIKPLTDELHAQEPADARHLPDDARSGSRAAFPSGSSSRCPKISAVEQVDRVRRRAGAARAAARPRAPARSRSRRWWRRRSSSSTQTGRSLLPSLIDAAAGG